MQTVHVCLVSDQTIPNIIGIHHEKPSKIIFASTAGMEEKGVTGAILTALRLNGRDYAQRSETVIVDQDSFDSCIKALRKIASGLSGCSITVNLTCGTKIMALAAFSVFRPIGARLVYTPIPRNEYIVIDECPETEPVHKLPLRLDVRSYISAYGIKIGNIQEAQVLKERAKRGREFSNWIVKNYADLENMLGHFAWQLNRDNARNMQFYDFSTKYDVRNRSESELLEMLGMRAGNISKRLNKLETCFITGDWLSDYCFETLTRLKVDDCVTGIELIDKHGNPNEFDVMFTKDNTLYTIECKSLKQKGDKDADILYKIAALQDNFGLRVRSFLVSTSREQLLDRRKNKIKEHLVRRARQFQTEIIHPEDIVDFSSWIKDKVKGL